MISDPLNPSDSEPHSPALVERATRGEADAQFTLGGLYKYGNVPKRSNLIQCAWSADALLARFSEVNCAHTWQDSFRKISSTSFFVISRSSVRIRLPAPS